VYFRDKKLSVSLCVFRAPLLLHSVSYIVLNHALSGPACKRTKGV
jgi:hypothetical protein